MKFLIITSPKDVMFTLPPKMLRGMLEGCFAYVQERKKAGTMLESYSISGSQRSVNVTEVAFNEELARCLSGNPIFPFLNIEVYPLSDWEEYMEM